MSADGVRTVVHPMAGQVNGTLRVPGDKSVSHRAAMLAGLAQGVSSITGFLRSEDCLYTLQAMESFGAKAAWGDGVLEITGTGGVLKQPDGPVYLGNSGTSIRLLSGLAAGFPIEVTFTGDPSLSRRPMGRIKDPLTKMGAVIDLQGGDGTTPPVHIRGGGLKPITYELPMASAQVKSCVLLAGLGTDGDTCVIEPRPTRDHTERMFQALGLPLEVEGLTITLHRQDPLIIPSGNWVVPGDFSSAAFHLVLAACIPGAAVTVEGVGLNPRRTALLDVLKRMGAGVLIQQEEDALEPYGAVTVTGNGLSGTVIEGDEIPNLIDELPAVAVLGAAADGEVEIRDAEELRVKESDRISTVAQNLKQFGVKVEERADGMVISGPNKIKGGATVHCGGDHRIAMSFSVLSLLADEPAAINHEGCIETSYPGFYNDLQKLGAYVE